MEEIFGRTARFFMSCGSGLDSIPTSFQRECAFQIVKYALPV